MQTLTWEQFVEQYKPVVNHIDDNASKDGFMFETYGEQDNFVQSQDTHKVWSVKSGDGDDEYITPGLGTVNCLGYIVTEVPWQDDNIEVIDEANEAEYPDDFFTRENEFSVEDFEL